MFQQSLVENSSQEESQVSETGVQAGETPENRVSQGDEKAPEEEGDISHGDQIKQTNYFSKTLFIRDFFLI